MLHNIAQIKSKAGANAAPPWIVVNRGFTDGSLDEHLLVLSGLNDACRAHVLFMTKSRLAPC
jgi:hypothetical protein